MTSLRPLRNHRDRVISKGKKCLLAHFSPKITLSPNFPLLVTFLPSSTFLLLYWSFFSWFWRFFLINYIQWWHIISTTNLLYCLSSSNLYTHSSSEINCKTLPMNVTNFYWLTCWFPASIQSTQISSSSTSTQLIFVLTIMHSISMVFTQSTYKSKNQWICKMSAKSV